LVPPLVDEVYTYGAPATHSTPFRNAATKDGCFPGLRSYTEDIKGATLTPFHQVDAASINNYYPHAWTNSVCLHWESDSYYTPCVGYPEPEGHEEHPEKHGHPDWPMRGAQIYEEWRLHHEDTYTDRLNECTVDGEKMANEEPFLSARGFVLFAFKAYDTVPNTKRDIAARMPEWHLVAREVYKTSNDQDPVHVVQNYKTLDCAFVFTGTNNIADLPASTNTYGTGYCGFTDVHAGYRNELWTLTENLWGKVRLVLEKCNKVICVGHSLGGALCELFAACANSGNYTDPDYQLLQWEKAKNATKMPELPDDYHASL